MAKLRRRAEVTKRNVAKYLSDLNLKHSEVETNSSEGVNLPKVILLAHSRFLLEYKGLDVNSDTEARDEIKFPHCKFVPDYTDYSKLDF